MNFQKEKEDDLEVLPLAEELFLLFFFDDPPPCDPAKRCMLDVFDFFATAVTIYDLWLLLLLPIIYYLLSITYYLLPIT